MRIESDKKTPYFWNSLSVYKKRFGANQGECQGECQVKIESLFIEFETRVE
jgi:hypothetical protein